MANKEFVSISHLGYKNGFKTIFQDLDLTLKRGKMIALLGENGAGKTTLMRILANVAKNITGEVKIDGIPLGIETKKKVSFLDTLSAFNRFEKLRNILMFYRMMYEDFDFNKAYDLMNFMNLDMDGKLGSLSTGNGEKFRMALALSRKASLYLLDEPLSGVDILAREKIIQALIQEFTENSSILVSTHHIAEMESMIDDVLIMKDQKIVIHKSADEIREETSLGLEAYYREIYA